MYALVEDITPIKAAVFLEKNDKNRKLSQKVVNRYAADMTAGRWEENGEPICISEDGTLKNGQHRLNAIIKANITVRMLVVYDVKSNIHEYDRGEKRSVANILELNNYPASIYANSFVGAINFLGMKAFNQRQISDKEIMTLIDNFGGICTSVMSLVNSGSTKPLCKSSGCVAAALVSLYYGVDREILAKFFECANSGFVDSNVQSAAITLRNYIITTRNATWADRKNLYLTTLFAIQDFKNGKPRRKAYCLTNPNPIDISMTETIKYWLEKPF